MYGPGDRSPDFTARDRSPAVTAIKWLCVLQLVISIIIFIVTIVLFALDFDAHKPNNMFHIEIILAVILCLLGMGAGIAGSKMSRNESLSYNLSHKSLTKSMSLMTIFAVMFYMIFAGTISFFYVDNVDLKLQSKNYRGAFAMVVVIFILGFIEMLLAVFTVILCVMWSPNKPKRYSTYGPPEPRGYVEYEDQYITKRDRPAYIRTGPPAYGPYERPYRVY